MPRVVVLVLLAILVAGGALAVPTARSASPDVVVSQVFAGGGNAGAPFQNDFVELFNRGSTTIDVSGWTIQYASAAGTTWQATALTGSIAPGRHYLVQLASAAAVGAALPTPDATGTTNLAVSGGKVAVVRDSSALTCGASAGSCSAVTSVADLVGYGTAVDYEGTGVAPALDNTTAELRGANGCADTDVNSTRLHSGRPRTAQLVQRGHDLQRRAAATHGRRLAERGGRHRHPIRPLDRARALRRQLRERDDGRHACSRLRAGHGRQQQLERVRA